MTMNIDIMGILNLTPNSFSDGGKFNTRFDAEEHFRSLVAQGANIIDIGAVSTGPGSEPITCEEEISRLNLIFENNFLNAYRDMIQLSVDTYRAEVASYVLERGVTIINDVSALRAEPKIVEVIASYNAKVVMMYSKKGKTFPHASKEPFEYESIVETITKFFEERIEFAVSNGIEKSKIILDPGMGVFLSPNSKYSWEVIKSVKIFKDRFKDFKILYGVSRKKFIKELTQLQDSLSLDSQSKKIEIELIQNGADIIRTHEVGMLKESLNEISYIIAFGGNIGDVISTFKSVFSQLNAGVGKITNISKIYRSKPLPTTAHGKQNQYLNGVLMLRSTLNPHLVLEHLIKIEKSLGRDRSLSAFWGPRKIDLDIISADNLIVDEPNLKIPHPRMRDRDFVLLPTQDVSPSWTDPIGGKSIVTLINELTQDQIFISEIVEIDFSSSVKSFLD